eukprot:scaffold3296_cov405-Prasinococcus_capsulatus_cf.AAC.20
MANQQTICHTAARSVSGRGSGLHAHRDGVDLQTSLAFAEMARGPLAYRTSTCYTVCHEAARSIRSA